MPKFAVTVWEESWTRYEVDADNEEGAEQEVFRRDGKAPDPIDEGHNGIVDIMIEEVE